MDGIHNLPRTLKNKRKKAKKKNGQRVERYKSKRRKHKWLMNKLKDVHLNQ